MHLLAKLLLTGLLCIASASIAQPQASYKTQIATLLQQTLAPEGVVFEIVNRDKHYLNWALPEAQRLSSQLRHKFPLLDIVIVSHGSEMFALTKQSLASNPQLNTLLQSLVKQNIDLHVCGTLAENRSVEPEAFTELVDVAAEGPAQINDYIKLGYLRIKLVK